MAKGFPGMPGNLQQLMKQAQKVQEDVKKAQEEAETLTAEATAGGGVVRAKVSMKEVLELEFKPEAVDPNDVEMLQDLAKTVINKALSEVQDEANALIKKATGGMAIPGM